jgi:hypothetical protein
MSWIYLSMIENLIFTVLGGIGIATILVEKSDDYPVSLISHPLKKILCLIFGIKVASVMECTVCISFWTTLICEIYSYYLFDSIFLWPFSGFIAASIVYYLVDFLNTLENKGK